MSTKYWQRFSMSQGHASSMQKDVEHGNPPEVEELAARSRRRVAWDSDPGHRESDCCNRGRWSTGPEVGRGLPLSRFSWFRQLGRAWSIDFS